jgi:acetoin utilization deacetylase AcuC-like enzyme
MIAARKIQVENRANLIWIVDLDAHKGCGTAELIQFARTKGALGHTAAQDILNLSIHMAKGWPLDEETLSTAKPDRAPRIKADVEIPIDRGEEAAYIPALKNGLTLLEKHSGHTKPDLVIVVDGADPYEYDGLPSSDSLKLSLDQCIERDTCVYTYLQERCFPSAWIMAGGYGERAWEPVAHFLRTLQM